MTWNYRIIEHDLEKSKYFALHEVYYNEEKQITNWTAEPIDITGESAGDISKMLKQMASDSTLPVLKESELSKRYP